MRHHNLNQLWSRQLHALQRDLVLQERRLSWYIGCFSGDWSRLLVGSERGGYQYREESCHFFLDGTMHERYGGIY